MLQIECPNCGARDESEFRYGGEAHVRRPHDPSALSDEAWADYLFFRNNPKGPHAERWAHADGCRRWFNVLRDTVTHRVLKSDGASAPAPDLAPFAKQKT